MAECLNWIGTRRPSGVVLELKTETRGKSKHQKQWFSTGGKGPLSAYDGGRQVCTITEPVLSPDKKCRAEPPNGGFSSRTTFY